MRSISKYEHCGECIKKCVNQCMSMRYAIMLAPTKQDADLCTRRYNRAVKHAKKYVALAKYYGGK